MFKIHKNFNEVDLSANNTNCDKNYEQNLGPASTVVKRRRSSIRLEKEFFKNCMVRETVFVNRVVDHWNELSD
jgi:hypothetical protein